jgi:hypothetical protein
VYVAQFAPFQQSGTPVNAQTAFDMLAMDQTQSLLFVDAKGNTYNVPVSYIVQHGVGKSDGSLPGMHAAFKIGVNSTLLKNEVFLVNDSNGRSLALQPNQMELFWTYIQLHAPAHYMITDAKVMGIERGIGEGQTYKDDTYMYFEYTNVGGYDASLFADFPNKIVRVDSSGHYTVGVPLTRFTPSQITNLLGASGEGIKFALRPDDETPEQEQAREDGQAEAEGDTQAEEEDGRIPGEGDSGGSVDYIPPTM